MQVGDSFDRVKTSKTNLETVMKKSFIKKIVRVINHHYFGDIATSPDVDDRHCKVLHSWLERLLKQFVANSIVAHIPVDVPLNNLLVPIQPLLGIYEFLKFNEEVVVWCLL